MARVRRDYTFTREGLHVDSNEVRRQWAERSGEFSPGYYAYYGPNETSEAIREIIEGALDGAPRVLEVGCSSGRHLAHLYEHGISDLAGIEVNEDAFDVMAEQYPALAERATLHAGAVEDLIGEFADSAFDVVYSVETLQHIHPDADWVFAELARVTDDLLITVENEGGRPTEDDRSAAHGSAPDDPEVNYVTDEVPLYYRDWNRVFTDAGLEAVETRATDRDTIRVFRQPTADTEQ
jgi:SAM-dependent methyltransferase